MFWLLASCCTLRLFTAKMGMTSLACLLPDTCAALFLVAGDPRCLLTEASWRRSSGNQEKINSSFSRLSSFQDRARARDSQKQTNSESTASKGQACLHAVTLFSLALWKASTLNHVTLCDTIISSDWSFGCAINPLEETLPKICNLTVQV